MNLEITLTSGKNWPLKQAPPCRTRKSFAARSQRQPRPGAGHSRADRPGRGRERQHRRADRRRGRRERAVAGAISAGAEAMQAAAIHRASPVTPPRPPQHSRHRPGRAPHGRPTQPGTTVAPAAPDHRRLRVTDGNLLNVNVDLNGDLTSPRRSTARSPPTPTPRRRSMPPWRQHRLDRLPSRRRRRSRTRSSTRTSTATRPRPATRSPTIDAVALMSVAQRPLVRRLPSTAYPPPRTTQRLSTARHVRAATCRPGGRLAAARRAAGLRLPASARAGAPRRRPDPPAHPAAVRRARSRRRRARPERSPRRRQRRRPAAASRATTSRTLVDEQLRPLGLRAQARRHAAGGRKANPLLALRFRYVVSDPERTRRITAPFAALFNPLLVVAGDWSRSWSCVLGAVRQGPRLGRARGFASPGLLLAGLRDHRAVSAGFHEFGHAAAARRGGGTPGAMGAGLYLSGRPSTPTSPTATGSAAAAGSAPTSAACTSTRSSRVAMFGIWWADRLGRAAAGRSPPRSCRWSGSCRPWCASTATTCWPTSPACPTCSTGSSRPCRPAARRSGGTREAQVLKPWARPSSPLWVLLVVPLLLLTVLRHGPRAAADHGDRAAQPRAPVAQLAAASAHGDVLGRPGKVLAVLAVALPVFGIGYMLVARGAAARALDLAAPPGRPGAARRWPASSPRRSSPALAFAWWPQRQLPAHPGLRARHAGRRAARRVRTPTRPACARAGRARRAPSGRRPAAADRRPSGAVAGAGARAARTATADVGLPVQPPAAPGPGDNQAHGGRTPQDGHASTTSRSRWCGPTGDTVLNKNEAYAFASCTKCQRGRGRLPGRAHRRAGARRRAAEHLGGGQLQLRPCVTQALAMQLVVTLPERPERHRGQRPRRPVGEIQEFSRQLAGLSFTRSTPGWSRTRRRSSRSSRRTRRRWSPPPRR